jgi:hypothetical protein
MQNDETTLAAGRSLCFRAGRARQGSKREAMRIPFYIFDNLAIFDRFRATLLSSEYPREIIRHWPSATGERCARRLVHRPRSNRLKRIVV